MAVNKGSTITGYAFPNVPEKWSPEEKRFALALRGLFDVLFQKTRGLKTDYEKNSYSGLTNKPSINGTVLNGNKQLSDIGIHAVNSTDAGLMTSEMLEILNDASAGVDYLMTQSILDQLDQMKAFLDYVTMMSQIDIPTDTGNKVSRVSYYYHTEVWNKPMVWDAVTKWITAEDYEEITGEEFPPYRPDEEEPEE
jgi:hypothetical protein